MSMTVPGRWRERSPLEVDAVRLTEGNVEQVLAWIADGGGTARWDGHRFIVIEFGAGRLYADMGDVLVRDPKGAVHVWDVDVFQARFEAVA